MHLVASPTPSGVTHCHRLRLSFSTWIVAFTSTSAPASPFSGQSCGNRCAGSRATQGRGE